MIFILNYLIRTIYDLDKNKYIKLNGIDYKYAIKKKKDTILGVELIFDNVIDDYHHNLINERFINIIKNDETFILKNIPGSTIYFEKIDFNERKKCIIENKNINTLDEAKDFISLNNFNKIIVINKHNVIMYWNHAFMDGMYLKKILSQLLNNNCIISKDVVSVFNPLLFINSMIKKENLYNHSGFLKKNLKEPFIYTFKINESVIKSQPDYINFNINFTKYILNFLQIDNAIIGTLMPCFFKNKNSFNNFCIMPFIYNNKFNTNDIKKKQINNYFYTLFTNLYLNNYENIDLFDYNINFDIDILFSGLSICKNNAQIGNLNITNINSDLPRISSKINVLSLKIKDEIHITLTIMDNNIANIIRNKI